MSSNVIIENCTYAINDLPPVCLDLVTKYNTVQQLYSILVFVGIWNIVMISILIYYIHKFLKSRGKL